MRRTENMTIDGDTYKVTQLPTTQGIPLGHRLMRSVGPTIVKFIKELPKGAQEIDENQLALVVVEALQQVDTALLMEAGQTFVGSCQLQAGGLFLPLETTYDDHFAGRFGSWLRWFVACARFNFAGFFPSSGASSVPSSTTEAAQ